MSSAGGISGGGPIRVDTSAADLDEKLKKSGQEPSGIKPGTTKQIISDLDAKNAAGNKDSTSLLPLSTSISHRIRTGATHPKAVSTAATSLPVSTDRLAMKIPPTTVKRSHSLGSKPSDAAIKATFGEYAKKATGTDGSTPLNPDDAADLAKLQANLQTPVGTAAVAGLASNGALGPGVNVITDPDGSISISRPLKDPVADPANPGAVDFSEVKREPFPLRELLQILNALMQSGNTQKQ